MASDIPPNGSATAVTPKKPWLGFFAQTFNWFSKIFRAVKTASENIRKVYSPAEVHLRRGRLVTEIKKVFPDPDQSGLQKTLLALRELFADQETRASRMLGTLLLFCCLLLIVLFLSALVSLRRPILFTGLSAALAIIGAALWFFGLYVFFIKLKFPGPVIFYFFPIVLLAVIPELLIRTGVWLRPAYGLDVIAAALFVSSSAGLSLLAFYCLGSAGEALGLGLRRWQYPRERLLQAFFKCLYELTAVKTQENWTDPMVRGVFLERFEDAAKCLETISKKFSTGDRFSTGWNRLEYLRRAAGIREFKKWVLMPKTDTRYNLDRELRGIIQLVALGDWDGLPQADLPSNAPVPWWRRLSEIIRSLLIAALPVVVVTFFGQMFLPNEILKNYATGAAWLWALISLLVVLDPRLGEKLSAFKDLPNFLQLGENRK
jgi:hypothetical protein